MRARIAAAFFLGCAVGAVGLGLALWRNGSLRTEAFRAQEQSLPASPGPLDATLSAEQKAKEGGALVPAPSQLPQDLPAGEADRVTEKAQSPAAASTSEKPAETPKTGEAARIVEPDKTAPQHETPEVAEHGSLPQLLLPVKGVKAESLRDTFHEVRDGHQHEALDIMAPRGTPVVAAAEGNVVKLFKSKPGGLTVYQFDNTKTYCYYYAHLDRYAPGLREGVLLRAGDVLGYAGSTGNADSKAPHLHFAVFRLGPEKQWWKGTAIDPLPLIKDEQPANQPKK